VSSYNFFGQYRILPGNEIRIASRKYATAPADYLLSEWPRSLEYLTEIRDPKAVACGDRYYMYHPPQPEDADINTNLRICRIIRLDRDTDSVVGSMRLRIAEDLTSPHLSATLEFKVTGMVESDEIEVEINSRLISAEQIERTYQPDGQQGDHRRVLPAFYLYHISLSSPPAMFGDNELLLRLIKSSGTEKLTAQEFEVSVKDSQLH
jgi:hypothetical protein